LAEAFHLNYVTQISAQEIVVTGGSNEFHDLVHLFLELWATHNRRSVFVAFLDEFSSFIDFLLRVNALRKSQLLITQKQCRRR